MLSCNLLDNEEVQNLTREELMAQLQINSEIMEAEKEGAFVRKLKEARLESEELSSKASKREISLVGQSQAPYLSNLNEDPMLSGVLIYTIHKNKV
ncbi:unnamed protein product [Protopolystoma xenopodis]|uniref:Uncharacterized protein n=1 Tax=Protopolystoma xenopodis TaxID=117903 RepID=A0A448WZ35_9PLAT|nr:unnamed protein product [Protopolystoma xenopodis]